MEFTVGIPTTIYGNYVEAEAIYDPSNEAFIAKIRGPQNLWNPETITVAFIIETLNSDGETSDERRYAYRRSWILTEEHIPWYSTAVESKLLYLLCVSNVNVTLRFSPPASKIGTLYALIFCQ